MREDIAKLICERQRRGSSAKSLKTGKKLNPNLDYDSGDFDWGPTHLSSSRRVQYGYDSKELNENLRPLFQFLEKSIGRPWNDVNSEIRSRIDPRRAIGYHVIQHVGWHVDVAHGVYPSWRRNALYVDQDTGILCKSEPYKYPEKPYVPPNVIVTNTKNFQFELEVLKTYAKCGCVHFKVPAHKDHYTGKYRYGRGSHYDDPAVCIHGNQPIPRPIWYLVEYGYHKPDDVYEVKHLRHYRRSDGTFVGDYARYGLSEENPVAKVYYRDVPHLMTKPFVVKKKTANSDQLKGIRKFLAEAAEKYAASK